MFAWRQDEQDRLEVRLAGTELAYPRAGRHRMSQGSISTGATSCSAMAIAADRVTSFYHVVVRPMIHSEQEKWTMHVGIVFEERLDDDFGHPMD